MPKAKSLVAPGKVANDRESLSSATQLASFGVRVSKFTYRFSSDGASNFLSNISLPAASSILAVSCHSPDGVAGATDVDVQVGGVDIVTAADLSSSGAQSLTVASTVQSGELGLVFNAAPTAGEVTVVVAHLDLSELS